MSRMSRLEELAKHKGDQPGPGRDTKNLAWWSSVATSHSQIAPRASDGPMELPSTAVKIRGTSMKPKQARKVDSAMARGDHNNVSSEGDYMPNVRRDA